MLLTQARCVSPLARARVSSARPRASRRASSSPPSSSARARGRGRAGTRASAAHHVVELASAFDAVNVDITLSGAEEALGKCAFASLALASGVFASKVRRARQFSSVWFLRFSRALEASSRYVCVGVRARTDDIARHR